MRGKEDEWHAMKASTDEGSLISRRLVLLNKLLEDGNTLYRKSRLREAAHRYSYALSKFPPTNELDSTFKQLRLNFLLNYSRCKRKMNVSIVGG